MNQVDFKDDTRFSPRTNEIPWFAGSSYVGSASTNVYPDWIFRVQANLQRLQRLQTNWDSLGAQKVDPQVCEFAQSVLRAIHRPGLPEPQFVPLTNGGVQIEWHENGVDLEIEVDRPNYVSVWFEDLQTGEEIEEPPASFDPSALHDQIEKLVR